MKKALGIMMVGALVASMATTAGAKSEKKNTPKNTRAAEEAVRAAGAEHFPEKMKIRKVGSLKAGETYFHIYCGVLKKGGYHAIVFDNTPTYLGYYKTEYEPVNYEKGAILVDMEDSDEDGNTRYEKIRVKETGPTDNTRIDGVAVKFIKAPEKKVVKTEEGTASGEESGPVFREWTINKTVVRAVYVSQTFGKVTLRAEASGAVKAFPISSISDEDKEYIKQFK